MNNLALSLLITTSVALTLPSFAKEDVVEKVSSKTKFDLASDSTSKKLADLRLLAPWSPKPLQRAPIGWRYVPASPASAFRKKVQLSNGKSLTLSVRPYALVPEKSPLVIQAVEPGYQADLGYVQKESVTASLTTSITALEKASQALESSITNLNDLVNSLPKQPQNNNSR